MLTEPYLNEIRARWEALRDTAIEIAAAEVLFVGHALSDIPRLLGALASGSPLSAEDADGIGMRIASASPGLWTAFIESDGGIDGSDVIRVSESDSEADMYLWMGPELAPPAIYRFVAESRQDLPALLAAARQ